MANLTENFSLEVGLKQWHYWFPQPSFELVSTESGANLPEVNVTVQVSQNQIIREVRDEKKIGLELVQPLKSDFMGKFDVFVDLSAFDTQGITRQTHYIINFSILKPVIKTNITTGWESNTTEGKNSAKIKKLDSTGLLIIEFTEPVILNETFQDLFQQQLQLGNPVIDFQILPGALSDPLNLNFEWSLTSVDNSTLNFQLRFIQPAYISSEANYPDKLLIIFRQPNLFQSTFNHSFETKYLSRRLQTQWSADLSKNAFAITSSLQSSMAVALTQNLILNLLLGGSLDQLWSLVEGLQIVLHSLLVNISIPQNALTFVTVFINVASFNLVPTNLITDKIFIEQSTEQYSENFNALGYQSLSPIQNMGLLIFLGCFYFMNQIVWTTIVIFLPQRFRSMRAAFWIQNNAFGQNFIRFIMEASLEVSVSYFLYLRNSPELTLSATSTASFFFIIIVLCPIVHCCYFIQKRNLIQSQAFSQVVKVYFQFLNLKAQILALCYGVVFSGRRILLALIFTQSHCLGIQILSIVILQTLVCVYMCLVQPFNEQSKNISEIRSEFTTSCFLVLLHCMTNFVVSAETRYLMGFVFSGFFCAYLAVNILQMFISSTKRSIILLKRWQAQKRQRSRVKGKKGTLHTADHQQVSAAEFSRTRQVVIAQETKKSGSIVQSQDDNDKKLIEIIDKILNENPQNLQEQQELSEYARIDAHATRIPPPEKQNNKFQQFENEIKDQQILQKQPIKRRQPIITNQHSEGSPELSKVKELRDKNTSEAQQVSLRNSLAEAGEDIVSSVARNRQTKVAGASAFASKNIKGAIKQATQIAPVITKPHLQSDEINDLELNDFIRRTDYWDPGVFKILVNGHEVGGALRC